MNPLMQAMGSKAGGMGNILQIMNMVRGKDPNDVMTMLAKKNPQFRQFMESCKGKTPEQVAQEYGVDLNAVRQFFR